MHIPDGGFIDGKTAATAAALSVAGVGLALRQVKRELPPRKTPMLGLTAAFLFAAQMLNFPVAGGTSGHLLGGLLAAVLLGPAPAVVVLTTVLVVQCFLFADGGVLALGANIFNMAIAGLIGGYGIYLGLKRLLPGLQGQVAAVAFAGWCSTVIASITCAGQLAWSGTVPWTAAFPAMTGIHMIIGIGEGLISALIFLAVSRLRPELVIAETAVGARRNTVVLGLLACVGLAVFVAPFASSLPDGLEAVAEKLGFEHRTSEAMSAPFPDYETPGITWPVGATAVAGLAGTLIVFGLALVLGRFLAKKQFHAGAGKEPT